MKKILFFFFLILAASAYSLTDIEAKAENYDMDGFYVPPYETLQDMDGFYSFEALYRQQSLLFAKLETVDKDRIRKIILDKAQGKNVTIPNEYSGFNVYIEKEVEKLKEQAKAAHDAKNRRVGCQMPAFYADAGNMHLDCWVCELVKHMFVVGNNLALRMFDVLAAPLKKLAAIALAIWILFEIANAFLNFKGINGREMLFNLGKMGLRFTFIFALLGAGTTIFEYTINPLMDITMGFGMKAHKNETALVCPQAAQITVEDTQGKRLFISQEAYTNICKMINGIYQQTRKIMDLGSTFFWKGWTAVTYKGWTLPSPILIITGLIIWVFFAILYIYFPFTILDSLFKLFMLTGLLPIFAVTWLFKITQDYTARAFGQIMGCCVHLMMVSIVFIIIEALLTAMFGGNAGGTGIDKLLEACAKGEFMQVISFLEGDQDTDGIAHGFMTTMTIMAIGIFSVLAVKKAGELSSEIAGAQVGGGVAEQALVSGAQMGGKAAGGTAKAGKAAGSYLSNK